MIESAKARNWTAVVQIGAIGLWLSGGDAAGQVRDPSFGIGSEAVASERIMEQDVWAASLVDVLGLAPALSDEASPTEVFGLLCPTGVERSTTSDGNGGSRGSVFQTEEMLTIAAPPGLFCWASNFQLSVAHRLPDGSIATPVTRFE